MPSQDAPDDGSIRESYNFAPGYFGLVYRADTSDRGAGQEEAQQQKEDGSAADIGQKSGVDAHTRADDEKDKPAYRLQAMKWGWLAPLPTNTIIELTGHIQVSFHSGPNAIPTTAQ